MVSAAISNTSRDLKPLAITRAELLELFDIRGGELFWKVKIKGINPGDLAGGLSENGYWRIKIRGRSYKRSRLVWLFINGTDSYPLFLDHINRNRSDDRIENLRLVTNGENQRNRTWGQSRFRYVYRDGGRWRARVPTSDGLVSLGRFDTETAAHEAVRRWESGDG